MRQRHKNLAAEAVLSTHKRPGTVTGLKDKIAEATPPPPNPNNVPMLALLSVRSFTGMGRIYAGTVPAAVVAKRRAANKRARIARRAARR